MTAAATNLHLTFLGTGTSSGVPLIACECAVCRSTDPRDSRLRTSAALTFVDPGGRERVILIDAGPDLRTQALRAGLKRCDAILFTHNHVDHIFGLDEVRRFNAVQHAPIDIFAEDSVHVHLRRVFAHIFDKHQNVNDSFVASLISRTLIPAQAFDLFGLTITPIRLLHGKLPVLGFRIEHAASGPSIPDPQSKVHTLIPLLPLAYCTDVSAIPPESWPHLRGLNTLVLDALRYRRHPTHFCFNQSLDVAHQVKPAQTYFVHMTHDIGHADAEKELPDNVHLAYDGLIL
ncbi:MBL fold metallo-hydrolase [soil metagenome]